MNDVIPRAERQQRADLEYVIDTGAQGASRSAHSLPNWSLCGV
jgi:hypothetical protein